MVKKQENNIQDIGQYHDVWVLAEQRDGAIRSVALELLGKGRELADMLGTQLVAVLPGHSAGEQSQELIYHGADKVLWLDDPALEHYQTGTYAEAITRQVNELKPEIFLIGATYLGRDLAPRLSQRLNTGLTADCTGLDIDTKERLLVQTRPAFGGNIMAAIVTPAHRPQMATVRPKVMQAMKRDASRKGEVVRVEEKTGPQSLMVKILEIVKEDKKKVDLEETEVIVAGGRGLGAAEGFEAVRELAELLGGEVGATRDAVDAGWIRNIHQVGQTGKTVRPTLYIACGISGAVQHTAGMSESETIVAINRDPEAPIFQIADYGIVADVNQALPLLTAEIKRLREGD
jgi:electron transfer flavoprotein alpha subunit